MNSQKLIEALSLPPESLVDLRIAKKTLVEQGAPTTADKRLLQDSIEELRWVAALKPTNIGIPAAVFPERDYAEIVVITVDLRPVAKAARIFELIHRAMPYPVVLIVAQGEANWLSLAHKRRSQAEKDVYVVEAVESVRVQLEAAPGQSELDFTAGLALAAQPSRDLFAAYQGWIDRMAALEAARITGGFRIAASEAAAEDRRQALREHAALQREIAALRQRAGREKQISRRVDINIAIKRLEAELAKATSKL